MPYEAVHRFARISARKVRPIADLIRGKHADDAINLLRYQPQRGARLLEKVLKSALGNAEDRRARNLQPLVVVETGIDEGPMFKRVMPGSRGMAALIKRRMCHIHVKLDALHEEEPAIAGQDEE